MLISLFFFLIFLVLSSSCYNIMDRDLENAIVTRLEPHLLPKFRELRELYKSGMSTNALERSLTKSSKSSEAISLIYQIPDFIDNNFFEALDGTVVFGDKYRSLLLLRMRSRNYSECNMYFGQLSAWHLIGLVTNNMYLSQSFLTSPSAFDLLEHVAVRLTIEVDKVCAEYNEVEYYKNRLTYESFGIIREAATESMNTSDQIIFPTEFLNLLDFETKYALMRMLPRASNFEALLRILIKSPLKFSCTLNAYRFWREFMFHNTELTSTNPELSLIKVPPPQVVRSTEDGLRYRLKALMEAMPRIFTWDHRLTSRLLLTGWSLVQYLKFASRLVTDLTLRKEMEEGLVEYLKAASEFFNRISKVVPNEVYSCEPGKCIFSKDITLTHFKLVSAPVPYGGHSKFHFSLRVNSGIDLGAVVREGSNEQHGELFIIIPEPTFNDNEARTAILNEHVARYCHSKDNVSKV